MASHNKEHASVETPREMDSRYIGSVYANEKNETKMPKKKSKQAANEIKEEAET